MNVPTPEPSHPPVPAPALFAESLGRGPRLVLAHGFTQTGRLWGSIDTDLARDHRVVRVDLPGHGGSTGVAADLDEGARLVGDVGGVATYLGYSLGARICLHLALARPELVTGLVLISGTAGIDDEPGRRQRRASDGELADELDPAPGSGRTATPVGAFVRRWLDAPMFAGISAEAGGREERLRNTGAGLASSLRLAGTGTQRPLWDEIGGLEMPVLIITGERDEKFTALGTRMARAIGPAATHAVVPGAGHAPHLQDPGRVTALVRTWTDGSGGP